MRWGRRPPPVANPDGACDELGEVWRVSVPHDDPPPYFIGHCECSWVGAAYDEWLPSSEADARRELEHHTSNRVAEVVRIDV